MGICNNSTLSISINWLSTMLIETSKLLVVLENKNIMNSL